MQLFALLQDNLRVLAYHELLPPVSDRLQESQQSDWRGEDNLLRQSELDDVGVALVGRHQARLNGDEQDDKFWGWLKLLPIALLCEALDRLSERFCMLR